MPAAGVKEQAGDHCRGTRGNPGRELKAERALKCGYPELFAQQALGHNSKAVHHAYSKHAEVTVPSLDDWEKSFRTGKNPGGMPKPAVVQVDFQSQQCGATIEGVQPGIGAAALAG